MTSPPNPPILGMYQTGGAFPVPGAAAWPSGPTTNLSATYLSWQADWPTYAAPFVAECNANGLVPFVELEPWEWDKTPIPFASIVNGAYDSQLAGYGTAIAATGKPIILTFAHEFNVSGQYPWAQSFTQTVGGTASGTGGANLTPAQWIAAWNYVRNKVNSTAGGLAIWMWACSAYTGGTTISPASYYPGSSNLDMVGIDGYPSTEFGTALGTFSGQIQPTVSILRGLGWTNPIFISETNLAQMANGPIVNGVHGTPGQSITDFVAAMAAAGISGILEFEDAAWDEPVMTSAQWAQYNAAVAANYGGGGGGGGGGGAPSYTQTLIDGFSGSTLNTSLWSEPVNSNGISVSGGKLLIEGLVNDEQVVLQTVFNRNLADGIFALQFSQSGTAVTGLIWFIAIADNPVSEGGNAYEFQTFPAGGTAGGAGSWYSWAFSGTDVSGDTGSQNILAPSVWNNGDWLGIGNFDLNGQNDVHVYKSGDGVNWTEIASFTVAGAINESAVGFYFGVEYDDGTTGTSTYLATIDNVSWFTRGAPSGGAALTATAHLTVTPARTARTSGGTPVTRASASLSVTPSLSATAVRTGLVQETSGSTTGTTLTLTFPHAVTIGHAVIVCIAGYYGGTVSGIALGKSGGTFAHNGSSGGTGGNNAGIWSNLSATQATATLTITTSAAGILAWAYEVAGTLALDVLAGNTGTGKSWSSGAVEPIPYPHFIAGLGSVVANTGPISGPASGWVNEPAITDVAGAGSHAIGAVSGYRQVTTSGAYTYSGTSGTSSAWGAVTAAFLIIPPGGAVQPAWGGVVFSEHSATGYTGVSATFTIPMLAGGQYHSVWVGLGNIIQVGIYQTYSTSYAGNSTSRPWTWWLPGAGEAWNAAAYPTAAGDTLTLSVQLTSADWLMTISNATRGWTYTEVRSVLAVNIGSISNNGAGPALWPNAPGQAVVIVEKTTTQLPAYNELAFTQVTTTPAATRLPYPVFTVNTSIDQYPGAFSLAAGSFIMYWNNYS